MVIDMTGLKIGIYILIGLVVLIAIGVIIREVIRGWRDKSK